MMRQWLAEKSATLFNVLFVMMEGLELEFRELAWRKTCFLFFVDFFQLLRILTLPVFGWSDRTSGLIEKFDIVYDFTLLGSMVVPRYAFFILAFFAVSFALVETAFVARIFEAGSVKQMWPVKVLRFLVVMMVTTLFSSLVKWLLIPLSCLVSEEASFSEAVHGEGTSCDPFRFPEILATVPTILVAVLYVTFAFVATTFSMQVNLLSRAPRSAFTGRVELLFLGNKVAATCLALLCNVVSPTAVGVVLLLISLSVFWLHVNTLPFHHHPTNVLRGGIYAATTWAAISSTIVSVNDHITLQWTLIALLPVMFLSGMWCVNFNRNKLLSALDRMRGEWEQRQYLADLQRTGSPEIRSSPYKGARRNSPLQMSSPYQSYLPPLHATESAETFTSRPGEGRRVGKSMTAMDRFYDTTGEKRRIFVSGRHAVACARVLLYGRRAEDKQFLEYVIDRGLEDFRDYQPLIVFRILVMSMVLDKQRAAKAEEKRIKDGGESLPIDLRYLLYCFERKTTQDMAAQNLGRQKGGQISAINLMEFNLGLSKAKEAHRKSLLAIKNCWRSIHRITKGILKPARTTSDTKAQTKSTSAGGVAGSFEEVVKLLEDFSQLTREAKNEYSSLLFKYPTSVELLFSYAAFMDVCMNDSTEADARLAQAVALQDGDGSDDDECNESRKAPKVHDDGKSATSGSSTSQDKRKMTARWVVSWQHRIMGHESADLAKLVFRIKISTLLLVVTATVAFVVSDFVLFKGMTKSEMHRVTSIGELYTEAVVICYTLRTLFLGALHHPGFDSFGEVQHHGLALAEDMQRKHVLLHSHVDFAEADYYFKHQHFTTVVPAAGGWKEDHASLWEIGNEFTTRAQLAFSVTEAELRNESFKLDAITDQKRNIPYMWENTFRVIVPTLEELKKIYVHEMDVIQRTVDLLVTINASCNSFLVVVITALVMRGLWTVVHRMECKALMCRLMASLSRKTSKRLYEYYRKAETALQELEDEDMERKALMNEDDDDNNLGNASPKSRGGEPESPDVTEHGLWDRPVMPSHYDSLYGDRPRSQMVPRQGKLPLSNDGPAESSSDSGEKVINGGLPAPISAKRFFLPSQKLQSPVHDVDDGPSGTGEVPKVMPLTAQNLEVFRSTSGEDANQKKRVHSSSSSDVLPPTPAMPGNALPESPATPGTEGLLLSERVLVARPPVQPVRMQSQLEEEGGGEGTAGRSEGSGENEDQDADEDEGVVPTTIRTILYGDEEEEAAAGSDARQQAAPTGDSRQEIVEIEDEITAADMVNSGLAADGDGSLADDKQASEQNESVKSEPRGQESPSILRHSPVLRPALKLGVSFLARSNSGLEQRPSSGHGNGSFKAPIVRQDSSRISPPAPRGGSPAGSPTGSANRDALRQGGLRQPEPPHKSWLGAARGSFLGRGFAKNAFSKSDASMSVTDEDREAAVAAELERALTKRRPWYIWTSTWLLMFAIVITLCVVSTVLATRDFGHLIALAPIVKEAGARLMLVKASGTFARELVLGDHFSGMSQQELSDVLAYSLHEMRHADRSLRLGDDPELGILKGADARNEFHNQVMYSSVCPWMEQDWQDLHATPAGVAASHRRGALHRPLAHHRRAGPSAGTGDDSKCKDPSKPTVGTGGLLSVLVAYQNALESVLHRYGVPADADRGAELMTYHDNGLEYLAESNHLVSEWTVRVDMAMVEELLHDEDVAFVLASVDGYLSQGLLFVMEIFDHELDEILEEAISLNEILFAFYVISLVVCFWWFLFRKAMAHASEEADSARALVRKMPLHILPPEDVDSIADYFKNSDEEDMEDEHGRTQSGPGA